MKKSFLLIFIGSTIFSCTNTSEEDLIDVIVPPVLVTYNTDIKVIMDNNCLGCHSNPPVNGANVPLVNFDGVKSAVENNNLISRISGQIGDGGFMPLGGPRLPQNLIDLVVQWEEDGLLEN